MPLLSLSSSLWPLGLTYKNLLPASSMLGRLVFAFPLQALHTLSSEGFSQHHIKHIKMRPHPALKIYIFAINF